MAPLYQALVIVERFERQQWEIMGSFCGFTPRRLKHARLYFGLTPVCSSAGLERERKLRGAELYQSL